MKIIRPALDNAERLTVLSIAVSGTHPPTTLRSTAWGSATTDRWATVVADELDRGRTLPDAYAAAGESPTGGGLSPELIDAALSVYDETGDRTWLDFAADQARRGVDRRRAAAAWEIRRTAWIVAAAVAAVVSVPNWRVAKLSADQPVDRWIEALPIVAVVIGIVGWILGRRLSRSAGPVEAADRWRLHASLAALSIADGPATLRRRRSAIETASGVRIDAAEQVSGERNPRRSSVDHLARRAAELWSTIDAAETSLPTGGRFEDWSDLAADADEVRSEATDRRQRLAAGVAAAVVAVVAVSLAAAWYLWVIRPLVDSMA